MLFDVFKPIDYDGIPIVDIIRDYRIYINKVLANYKLINYTIIGNPTTEFLSYRLYGDPYLFWLLIYINDITDPWHGWIKSQEAVYESARQKYKNKGGVGQVVYHQNDKFERFYDLVEYPKYSEVWYHKGDTEYKHPQYVGTLHPVYVYEAEEIENEKKRVIKIIKPNDINSFIKDLRNELEKAKRGGAV